MTTLTMKQRDTMKSLLDEHVTISNALAKVGKIGFYIYLTNDDTSDDATVTLNLDIARRAIEEQIEVTEEELAKLGIEIKRK
jgi:hypothetical protein